MSRLVSTAACSFRKTILIAATFLIVACANEPAWAGTILDLSIGSGGIFGYATGERAPRFYGAGVEVKNMTFGARELSLIKGRLNFSDKNFLSSSSGNYFWGPGGTLSVTGTLDGFKGTLFTGTFLSAEVVNVNGKEMLEAQVRDQINPQLAALLHLSSTTYTGQLDLLLSSFQSGRWWTRDRIQGGSLIDGNVPEPSSIWLLGATLCCLACVRFSRGLLAKFSLG